MERTWTVHSFWSTSQTGPLNTPKRIWHFLLWYLWWRLHPLHINRLGNLVKGEITHSRIWYWCSYHHHRQWRTVGSPRNRKRNLFYSTLTRAEARMPAKNRHHNHAEIHNPCMYHFCSCTCFNTDTETPLMIPWVILHTFRLAAEINLVSDECQKTESCPGHNDCNYMDHLLHRIFCLPG
jgi:hypothetical protein